MPKLSLDILNLLNIVKQTGSFSVAAEKLNRTPSAISYRVSSIEHKLGMKLFKRNGPIVALTSVGEKIVSDGSWILKAVDNLESSLDINTTANHIFKIGVGESFSACLFGTYISRFLATYPKVKVKVKKTNNGAEWEGLQDSLVDLIISGTPCPSCINVKKKPLCTNKIICCATPEYIQGYDRVKTAENKALDNNFTVISNSNFDKILNHNSSSLKLCNRLLVDDISIQISLIRNNCGFGLVPYFSVMDLIQSGELRVIEIDNDLGYEIVWAGWNSCRNSRYTQWWLNQFEEKLTMDISSLSTLN